MVELRPRYAYRRIARVSERGATRATGWPRGAARPGDDERHDGARRSNDVATRTPLLSRRRGTYRATDVPAGPCTAAEVEPKYDG